jgi:diaminopimelate decarboxylase
MAAQPALLPSGTDPTPAELIAARPALAMHAMDGLAFADVPLNAIADAIGTPTWVYAAPVMRRRIRALAAALAGAGLDAAIHYAVKANDHLAVLDVFARQDAGADVVSEGELLRARQAGIPASRIVFSGVGKSPRELQLAIAEGIAQINIESAEELDAVAAVAAGMGRSACVALRINPDVDADTHAKITTGRAHDKFGVPHDQAVALYRRAASMSHVRPVGLATHIGSQILTMAPYRAAFARLRGLVLALREAGETVEMVDCGGGIGVTYRDEPEGNPAALAGAIAGAFGDLGLRVAVEPGRWLVASAGLLLASVVLAKQVGAERFVVLDAAMNDLVRPAMYDAWHGVVPVSATDAAARLSPADVVGPVCESSDTFARSRMLPPLAPNARVAILDAGAYGAVMSSTYNARPLAAQVLIDNGTWAVIRERQEHAALWAGERIPGRRD